MRKILIVGAGQAGLQLALSLLDHHYDVTVISQRTPEEIRNGRISSTQCMFGEALRHERDHGLNRWERVAPRVEGVGVSIADPEGNRVMDWHGVLDEFAQSVDQRIKMAGWLELLEERGGTVRYQEVAAAELDVLAESYDLVLVAAGRGELVELFDRDHDRSPYAEPQRMLSVAYVHGAGRRPEHPDIDAVRFNVVPGEGELFVIPGYTFTGPCEMPFFEAVPGGALDRFSDRPEPAEHWARMLELMRRHVPWEHERFKDAVLTDEHATLAGGFTPTVRRPVGRLPSGGVVLGVADAVVANDPITGQGANSAGKCAQSYLNSILERGEESFNAEWMQRTFDAFWKQAQYVTAWTNAMLRPPPEHVLQVFGAASANPAVARRVVNGFNDPQDLSTWFLDPEGAAKMLEEEAVAEV